MYDNDPFSQWLGIEVIRVDVGECKLRMVIRDEMTNGFGVAHGGVSFSFADSAFAFASNSRGKHAVSIETSISHTQPIRVDDVLTAVAQEDHRGRKTGNYSVIITNQNDDVVALFKGTVYIKKVAW